MIRKKNAKPRKRRSGRKAKPGARVTAVDLFLLEGYRNLARLEAENAELRRSR